MTNILDDNYLDYPTYKLYKKIYERRYCYYYQEFLELINQDPVLNNLTDHDKKLYFEFINNMYNSIFYANYMKIEEKNKYNIKYRNADIISLCYIMYHNDDLNKFEEYIRLFYQELRIDINPSIYYLFNLYKLGFGFRRDALDMIDILLKYNLIIDQQVLDYIKQDKELYNYLEKYLSPDIKDPGYD